jgi:hypothetical protein
MPGAGRDPWPACRKKAGGSHHRYSRTSGIPCAMGLGLYVISPGTGFLAPVVRVMPGAPPRTWSQHRETKTTRLHRPHQARSSDAPSAATAPRLALRDDRPKRPSSSRRDARKDRLDLPDEASRTTATNWHDGQFAHSRPRGFAGMPAMRLLRLLHRRAALVAGQPFHIGRVLLADSRVLPFRCRA